MDANSSNNKRGGSTVVSRRGGGHPAQATPEEVRPMLPPVTGINKGTHSTAPAPRSGQFILPTFSSTNNKNSNKNTTTNNNDSKDDHHKRRYRVNLPTRMLLILATVFLAIPLLVFFYKEVHIHDGHDEAHFKPEKFVNVNARDVMSQFSNRAEEMKQEEELIVEPQYDEKNSPSSDEKITANDATELEEKKSSSDSPSGDEEESKVELSSEQAEELSKEQSETHEGSSDEGEEKLPEEVGSDGKGGGGDGDGDAGNGEEEDDGDAKSDGQGEKDNGDEEGERQRTKRIRRRV